ncbi:MAG: bifunctional 3-hydroxydecanoyl-ACP dehydratase/trans-2-decenoyl-ACP isomerase [Desulfobacterales bacterium]|nr:bifunctional 3-hydroxydecanoyl-ACP dehydratase/trans-2-decenoyl-ACP isomerase [Desulfobacterales bacterium]
MQYNEFMNKTSFNLVELIALAYGRLIENPPSHFDARLPAPPFLMIDRILSMEKHGNKGYILAEQDIRLDAWYFQCHFPNDPVQPGCLGVDAIWQLMGFYSLWRGALGSGRALGCGEVSFDGQIRPYNKIVRFEIEVTRYSEMKTSGASLIIADGVILVDGEKIATVKKARTGIFKEIAYKDYPLKSQYAIGGIMHRNEPI